MFGPSYYFLNKKPTISTTIFNKKILENLSCEFEHIFTLLIVIFYSPS